MNSPRHHRLRPGESECPHPSRVQVWLSQTSEESPESVLFISSIRNRCRVLLHRGQVVSATALTGASPRLRVYIRKFRNCHCPSPLVPLYLLRKDLSRKGHLWSHLTRVQNRQPLQRLPFPQSAVPKVLHLRLLEAMVPQVLSCRGCQH